MSELMRAVVLEKAGSPYVLQIKNILKPKPRRGEVLIKVCGAGVCHSDLHVALGEIPFPIPAVLGHEVSGVIEEVGEGVEGFQRGDRVVATFIIPCGECYYCRIGREDLCEKFYNYNRLKGVYFDGDTRLRDVDGSPIYMYSMGAWAEYSVIPVRDVFKVPPNLPLDKVSVIGCAVMTAFGACRNASLSPGETIVVYGIGGVGSSVVHIAKKVYGVRVIAVDIDDNKLDYATKLGADYVINSRREDPVSTVLKLTNGRGADAAFEAIGLPLTISQAIKSVRAGGRAVIIGLSRSDAEASFNINALVRRGVQIIGSYGGIPSRDIPAILDLLSRGVLNIDYIVQNVYEGIDEIPRALKELEQGKVLGRPVVRISREC